MTNMWYQLQIIIITLMMTIAYMNSVVTIWQERSKFFPCINSLNPLNYLIKWILLLTFNFTDEEDEVQCI